MRELLVDYEALFITAKKRNSTMFKSFKSWTGISSMKNFTRIIYDRGRGISALLKANEN
jgi:hypothetical protein